MSSLNYSMNYKNEAAFKSSRWINSTIAKIGLRILKIIQKQLYVCLM